MSDTPSPADVERLIGDAEYFAKGARQHRTPWGDGVASMFMACAEHLHALSAQVATLQAERDAAVALLRAVNQRGSCATDQADCHGSSGPLCDTHDFTLNDEVTAIRAWLADFDAKQK